MTLTHGSRRFVFWMAHLALVIYIAQIVAIDHWHADPASNAGMPPGNAHAQHCHGNSSCSEGASVSTALLKPATNPLPPAPRLYNVVPSPTAPADVYVVTLREPPRAA